MTFYYKERGADNFFRVSGAVRISNKGYMVLRVEAVEPVTKHYYYKNAPQRFSRICRVKVGDEISEVGEEFLPWPEINSEKRRNRIIEEHLFWVKCCENHLQCEEDPKEKEFYAKMKEHHENCLQELSSAPSPDAWVPSHLCR